MALAAGPLTDPEDASVLDGLDVMLSTLAADTADAAGAAMTCWTEMFVKDGVMVERGSMSVALSSGTAAVTADKSVVFWTDSAAETAAVFS